MLRSARPTSRLSRGVIAGVGAKAFSGSTSRASYEDTIENLKIGSHTRVIFQGFTGILNSPLAVAKSCHRSRITSNMWQENK